MKNIEDVLQWADNLVFAQTGEHLTHIQEAILKGVWQRQKYPQIAKDVNCSESHVKKEAAKLWEKLGEELGEDLNKFNFRSKLEKKYRVSQVSNFVDVQVGNINICNESLATIKDTQTRSHSPQLPQNQNPSPIDYFRCDRCLVILDDVHNIFKIGQLAGQYLTGYEDYGKFFKQVATSSHQSCLILLSWEKPREITSLEGENRPARTLHLKGLGEQAEEILREKGLTDEEQWSELITLYQGHPSWLNIIAATIQELFNGSVSLFLAEQNEIFLGDIEPLLETHLERLSESEKQVSYWLASLDKAVDISQQPANSALSKSEFWQAIQSLARRGLVEKVQVGVRSHFQINFIFKQYIQSQSYHVR